MSLPGDINLYRMMRRRSESPADAVGATDAADTTDAMDAMGATDAIK